MHRFHGNTSFSNFSYKKLALGKLVLYYSGDHHPLLALGLCASEHRTGFISRNRVWVFSFLVV
jgi:hypothetical protein